MMRKSLLLVSVMLSSISLSWAQWKPVGIEAAVAPSIGVHTYETNNKLIFDRRQGNGTVSFSMHLPAMLEWSNGSRHRLYTGLGLRYDAFTMNSTNFGDALFSILIIPFGGRPRPDTFRINSVTNNVLALTMPLAYDYNLTKNKNAGIEFHVRALLVPGISVYKQSNVSPIGEPGNSGAPTEAELQQLEKEYEKELKSFSCLFAPEINMTIPLVKQQFGMSMGLQPFAVDLASPFAHFYNGALQIRGTMSLYYRWK